MKAGFITRVTAAALLLLLAGCGSGPRRAIAIGEAYVGPSTLKIRADIAMESRTVATVKHGDRLEILQRRRSFLRVRTANDAEGWTDDRELLAASDMAALKQLAERARRLPSQGQAFSFREMTVHTLPADKSPSFLTLRPNEKVDVLTHLRTERKDLPRKPLIPPAPKKVKTSKTGPAKAPKYPPPPMPKPPAPPPNWLELSKTDVDDEEDPPETAPAPKIMPTDDWSLVRAASGQSGWVLTRRLIMAIPDEVAQYAEGKRIVSYFALGWVMDGAEKKPAWLWTTTAGGPQPYDFDSLRVFIWSVRRHRYETAHVERNLRGHSPVLLREVDFAATAKGKEPAETAKYPGFSVCVEDAEGQKLRREYAWLGNTVLYAGEQACEVSSPMVTTETAPARKDASAAGDQPPQPAPSESMAERLRRRLRTLTKGLFGG